MRPIHCLLASLALLAVFITAPVRAETYHTCGTFIASLPTVISTQGVYCLNKDLTTAITSGNAIDITTNNVTIDCNGYKIGGLAAGVGSLTNGIHGGASNVNITVRNCGIRGFSEGILLEGGSGHLVEDNRLDNNLYIGINLQGENNLVQRNRVFDTGGATTGGTVYGIAVHGDIVDNIVSGMIPTVAGGTTLYGIADFLASTQIHGNKISGLTGSSSNIGIEANGNAIAVSGNVVTASAATTGTGILGLGVTNTICSNNDIFKFSTPISTCQDGGGNASN
jgi:parallel beta-helix repeat protein